MFLLACAAIPALYMTVPKTAAHCPSGLTTDFTDSPAACNRLAIAVNPFLLAHTSAVNGPRPPQLELCGGIPVSVRSGRVGASVRR